MSFGLPGEAIERIKAVFRRHPEIERVQIFGSRAKGNYRHNSDIDLVFWGNNIDESLLAALAQELDELPLPYLFDIKNYAEITHDGLREHIQQYGKDFYVRLD